MTFEELTALEKKYDLWAYKVFDYPLWMHCREPLVSAGIMADRKIKQPTIGGMLKSFFQTIKFLVTQKKYKKVFFLMERAELLEIYHQEKEEKKLLFLNPEQQTVYTGTDYISSDFFNLLRFVSRKAAFVIFFKQYQYIMKDLLKKGIDKKLNPYIKIAIGDALFLKIISIILAKNTQKFYSGCVIPMGEKFLNRLNSFEVQHGVIYPWHIGYMQIPKVENVLIVYNQFYNSMMKKNGYRGKILLNEYKNFFFEKESTRHFPIVIYTQPILEMQEGIEAFLKENRPEHVYIQKHPKDYFEYSIDRKFLITATIPKEVSYPIIYTSTIIENFLIYNRKCYIYDIGLPSFDLESFLGIFTKNRREEMIIMHNLNEIYHLIEKDIPLLR